MFSSDLIEQFDLRLLDFLNSYLHLTHISKAYCSYYAYFDVRVIRVFRLVFLSYILTGCTSFFGHLDSDDSIYVCNWRNKDESNNFFM